MVCSVKSFKVIVHIHFFLKEKVYFYENHNIDSFSYSRRRKVVCTAGKTNIILLAS